MPSSRNCGFCSEPGHTMFKCTHPATIFINTKFDATLRENTENPFPVLNWLEVQPAKTIKMLANKNNVPHIGKKWDMIESLMELHYPEYQNPLWLLPKEECTLILNKLHKLITRVLHFQTELVDVGILPEEQYERNALYNMPPHDVFVIYTDLYTDHSGQFVDIMTNFNRQFKIALLQTHDDHAHDGQGTEECPICYDALTPTTRVQLNCGHAFCGDCVIQILTKNKKEKCAGSLPFCAMCRCRYKTFAIPPVAEELKNKITPFLFVYTPATTRPTTEV